MAKSLQRFIAGGCAAALAAVLAMSGVTAQPARQRTLVLAGGTLIDGTGRAPITDAVVVVQGDRITAVGKRGQVRIPAGAQIIKTDNRTILPGLIDSHVHTQDYHLPMFLHFGVTTFLSKDSDPAWTITTREGLKNGTIKGPRMFWTGGTVGGVVTPRGQEAWNRRVTRTPEEIVAFARGQVANGAEAINMNQSINEAQLKALIAFGQEKHVPILGHVPNIRRAAELGYKFQEHMFMMGAAALDPQNKVPQIGLATAFAPEALADPAKFPELVSILVKNGVFINSTMVNNWSSEAPGYAEMVRETAQMAKDPQFNLVPQQVRDLWSSPPADRRQGYANIAEFVRQIAAAGGKNIVGTDAGYRTIPGLSVHQEMKLLVDVGVTPMQAIQGATLWNAQLLQQDKDLGSIEPGKFADFLIIEGDPLKDIRATRNIRMVIKGGEVMDTKLDPNWVNPIPAPFGQYFPESQGEITKVTPAIVRQGGQSVTLEIDVTKFSARQAGIMPGSIVRFDNVDLPTKAVSPTKLQATLDASLLKKAPGLYPLYIVTPGLHGTISELAYEVIDTAENPVTLLPIPYDTYSDAATRLYGPFPRSAPQGGQTLTVEIEGTKFAPNAIVRFDNEDLPTKFISSTKLSATLDAKLLQRAPGSYVFYVVTPGTFGSLSKPAYFQVGLKNSKMVWSEWPRN